MPSEGFPRQEEEDTLEAWDNDLLATHVEILQYPVIITTILMNYSKISDLDLWFWERWTLKPSPLLCLRQRDSCDLPKLGSRWISLTCTWGLAWGFSVEYLDFRKIVRAPKWPQICFIFSSLFQEFEEITLLGQSVWEVTWSRNWKEARLEARSSSPNFKWSGSWQRSDMGGGGGGSDPRAIFWDDNLEWKGD